VFLDKERAMDNVQNIIFVRENSLSHIVTPGKFDHGIYTNLQIFCEFYLNKNTTVTLICTLAEQVHITFNNDKPQ
jgi:hypothetical protein